MVTGRGLTQLSKEELIEIILNLQKEVEELKAELSKYKNSNTPTSANKHMKPNTKGKKSKKNKKRGAPFGHKGKTRKQKPSRKVIIDTDTCNNCGSHNIKDKKLHKRIVEEINEPPIPETIEYEIHVKECLDCGKVFIPKDNQIPLKGKFGINIMILVVFLKFLLRGVLRKIVSYLYLGYALRMTPASINTILQRTSKVAESKYEALKTSIRSTGIVYVDETSFSVLGKNWWVWVFRTKTDILLVIRNSRGSDVLKEILGLDYDGVVVCDCWRAYNFLKKLQRCWAHLLRKAEALRDTVPGKYLYKKVKALFKEIKKFNKSNQSKSKRIRKYEEMVSKLKAITDYYKKYDHLKKIIGYIKNNIGNWFTCIKYEGIEPTNNFAEQAIRETVVVRKIIGAFRSESGTENYTILASLLASWKLNGLDIKQKLKEMLVQKLCFC